MTDNEPIIVNHKQALIELCARNVIRHAFGNVKYTPDLEKQYEFIMQEANPMMQQLVKSIIEAIGMQP